MTTPGGVDNAALDAVATWSKEGSAGWMNEQLVLGALLRRPERVAGIGHWLAAGQFGHPPHRGVYDTITGLHAVGELRPVTDETTTARENLDAPNTQAVVENLRLVRSALEAGRFTDVPYDGYHGLVREIYDVGETASADLYTLCGHRVLQAAASVRIAQWGVRMAWAAAAEPTASGDPGLLDATLAAMTGDLNDLDVRLRQSVATDGVVGRIPATAPATPPPLRPTPAPHPVLVQRAELHLIEAVLNDPPGQHAELLDRFQPDAFVWSTKHANTWRAIQAVARNGEPISPATVAWESELQAADPRNGDHRDGLDGFELVRLNAPRTADTVKRAADTVKRSALHHYGEQIQQDVIGAVADRRAGVQTAMGVAQDAGTALQKKFDRLTGPARGTAQRSTVDRRLSGEPATTAQTPHSPAR